MAKTGEKFYERTEGKDGKVHQVVKFNPDGKVLLALGKAGVAETARTHSIDPRPLSLLQATIFVADGRYLVYDRSDTAGFLTKPRSRHACISRILVLISRRLWQVIHPEKNLNKLEQLRHCLWIHI